MTRVLNVITHIHTYAGVGMALFVIGAALIIFAAIKLSRLRRAERSRTVAEFNQQFAADTGARITDIEAGERRKAIADSLGIGSRR